MSKEATIGMNSSIKLELLIAVLVILAPLAGGWYELHSLRKNLWTKQQQLLWAERLQAKNPALQIPNVTDVAKAMEPTGQN